MDTKRIMGVLCVLMVSAYASTATALTNVNMEWAGVVVNTDADTLAYSSNSAAYTWTLNEDELGNPADVTWGDVNDTLGRCPLGYYSSAKVTISLTIQTTVGAPGVLNYIGDSNYSIRLAHVDDTAILNIESGNTLLVNKLYKYENASTLPSQAIVNINDGHIFSYGAPGPRVMTGLTVNIAEGSSLRIMADIANVYNPATYAVYTTGTDTYAGSVNALGGAVLQFADGGNYNDSPTVLITAVPEPATMLLLGLGSLGMLWKKR